ncbi:IGR protein motif-domain-containing protein [Lophiotrema nucula]|uniref:Small ribosomal subunit protein mS41 n=1 Tax=Lophiotrema nucula TaxID=690887 RepID=A0A6A5Z1R0_9PLEO|nr:IGR protein motif-domain-containing protein [Lophiotrema nucula]
MVLRRPILRATSTIPSAVSTPQTCSRAYRTTIPQRPVPKPIPFIPDTTAFLTAIGRGLSAHSAKIPSWDALFTLTSVQLKDLGVEPARSRRYLLQWRERFRNGEFGVGGDCQHVQDGIAELKLIEAPVPAPARGQTQSLRTMIATATHDPGTRKVVVNIPKDQEGPSNWENLDGVKGYVVKGAKNIKGPYVEYVKGSGGLRARLRLQEGVWEVRRGHKVDGGERRRAEVRAKRRAAENKEKNR